MSFGYLKYCHAHFVSLKLKKSFKVSVTQRTKIEAHRKKKGAEFARVLIGCLHF